MESQFGKFWLNILKIVLFSAHKQKIMEGRRWIHTLDIVCVFTITQFNKILVYTCNGPSPVLALGIQKPILLKATLLHGIINKHRWPGNRERKANITLTNSTKLETTKTPLTERSSITKWFLLRNKSQVFSL